jgi:predicted metal-dependent phosphoesterase TrpH
MEEEVSLERLNRQLQMCSRMLDECAGLVRDLELNPKENIRKIGEALRLIFAILDDIYKQRPDLTPKHLKEELARPGNATEADREYLRYLRDIADGHRLYLERLECWIRELEDTVKQDRDKKEGGLAL